MGTSWMKLLNRYRSKKYRNKSVQLTMTSIIISHTHAPLKLLYCRCKSQFAMTLMVTIAMERNLIVRKCALI